MDATVSWLVSARTVLNATLIQGNASAPPAGGERGVMKVSRNQTSFYNNIFLNVDKFANSVV